MHIPLPMFLLRRLVRRNPWLLAERGSTRRTITLDLWICELEVEAETALTPVQKRRLQSEADAGTLLR